MNTYQVILLLALLAVLNGAAYWLHTRHDNGDLACMVYAFAFACDAASIIGSTLALFAYLGTLA